MTAFEEWRAQLAAFREARWKTKDEAWQRAALRAALLPLTERRDGQIGIYRQAQILLTCAELSVFEALAGRKPECTNRNVRALGSTDWKEGSERCEHFGRQARFHPIRRFGRRLARPPGSSKAPLV